MQLDFLHQSGCIDFSLATDLYGYGYTSYENLSDFAMNVEEYRHFLDLKHFCHRFAAYFICNYVFVPCDLFTGAPRPICTESCYYFHTYCNETYRTILLIRTRSFTIMDNCDNTLVHLQTEYGFPCSSGSLKNNCIDLLG